MSVPCKLVPCDVYEELLDFLNDKADVVDGDDGKPRPNQAMRLAVDLEVCKDAPPAPK